MDIVINSIALLCFIGLSLFCFVTVQRLRRDSESAKQRPREERAARQPADRRRNLGGRIFNALTAAAAENATPTGLCVWRSDLNDAYYVQVQRERCNTRYERLLTVTVRESRGTGFELVVDGDLWAWTKYDGPQEFFVEELIPRLGKVVSGYSR